MLSAIKLRYSAPAEGNCLNYGKIRLMTGPQKLWIPGRAFIEQSNLTRFSRWLEKHRGLKISRYEELWQWSVDHIVEFWESIWEYFQVISHHPYEKVVSEDAMPFTRWFEGSTLNYAEHIFRMKSAQRPAMIFVSEQQAPREISWQYLEEQTAALQGYLQACGVAPGDRVAAYLPNVPEATVSMLATISLGAVWSSCSPDFGADSVVDRFRQIAPKVLIATDGYRYNGKFYHRLPVIHKIRKAIPSLEKVILVPCLEERPAFLEREIVLWKEAVNMPHEPLFFRPVPFAHPIWILYSSGTTGIPKAITHSHGGMLLEHLKYLSFHNDVQPGERFFWYSTTGWMMWNFVQASLLTGATAVLYDGSPGFPDMDVLWRLAASLPIHHFGTSAPFIAACMKAGLHPGEKHDLSTLRSIGSTGSPLSAEAFGYVYQHIRQDVWLCSMSGGTDVCTAWAGGCPWRPVYGGELQCRCLGASMYAFDEAGHALQEEVGEMVVTRPMPCMPVYFWNDPEYVRYKASYFEMYPGVWRHGDWLKITEHDGLVILGRSDATLNRQGVRIGTAEIYRALQFVPEISDALILNLELAGGGDYMPLFVVPEKDIALTDELRERICRQIRQAFSPRHVPDDIIAVPDIPYTISGKKLEAPVKRILQGVAAEKAVNKDAVRNPASLQFFLEFAKEWEKKVPR